MLDLTVHGLKELEAFIQSDFEGRVLAIQKYLMRTLAEEIHQAVFNAIPDTEEWLRVYKKSLHIYEIDELPPGEFGFAVASRVSGDWSMVDGSTMIVYFDHDPRSEDADVGEIMSKFSPFTVDQVPVIDIYGARARMRRVRSDEIEAVREKNLKDREDLVEDLDKVGQQVQSGHAEIKGQIFFDLHFAVMRMELSLGDIRKPHWRPALKKIGVFMHKAVMSSEVHKTLAKYFDPDSVAWEGESKAVYKTMRLKTAEEFGDFQKRLMPRTL